MKRLILALSTVVFLGACSDNNEKQSDPINNTPPQQSNNTAPADKDPTPQTGTGGQSPATSPSGTTSNPPVTPPPAGGGNP
jgi:PBP1b-binding outer membrane lipoprotein LpoB